jgi:hypothetical protein
MTARCVRCYWESIGVNQGLIRGLCAECTMTIKDKARDRGIYLDVLPGREPPRPHRERRVNGIRLWWWGKQWRAEL